MSILQVGRSFFSPQRDRDAPAEPGELSFRRSPRVFGDIFRINLLHVSPFLCPCLLSEQINPEQRHKKIRNENSRASIVLCHSLPEKERKDRRRGNDAT